MPLWRRKSLHERLAEEGGVVFGPETPAHDTYPRWGEAGIHGLHRPREWDALVGAEAPGIAGERARFVALPDGTLVVEEGDEDQDLAGLAEAVEASLQPPYRAEAVRQGEARWTVGARSIEVIELLDAMGEELTLTMREGVRELVVDGARAFGGVPDLERLAEGRHSSYVARAGRLDGDLWEVELHPL